MKRYPKSIRDIIIGIVISVCTSSSAIMAFMLYKWSKSKPMLIGGISISVLYAGAIAGFSFMEEDSYAFSSLLLFAALMLSVAVLFYIPEYIRRMNLMYTVKEYKINPEALNADSSFDVNSYPNLLKYAKTSKSLYKEKWVSVLDAINSISERELRAEVEAKKAAEEERLQKAKIQKQAEEARKRKEQELLAQHQKQEAIRLENERKIKEAEAKAKELELEKIKAEAKTKEFELEKARAEAEARAKEAELEKVKLEAKAREKDFQNQQFKTATVFDSKPNNVNIIDINSCSESELATVPGIGLILAKKAVALRDASGGFNSLSDFFDALNINESLRQLLSKRLTCEEKHTSPKGRKIDF